MMAPAGYLTLRAGAEARGAVAVIVRVGLAVAGIFIGRNELEISRVQPGPADARHSGDGGEERVGRKGGAQPEGAGQAHGLRRLFGKAAENACVAEVHGVEFLKNRLVVEHPGAVNVHKSCPESVLIPA